MVIDGKVQYKERYVAFIDILGFKHMVKESLMSNECFDKIVDGMDIFWTEKVSNDLDADFVASLRNGRRITSFSDSIVISYDAKAVDAGYFLLSDLAYITLKLLDRKIMIRGGAAFGKLVHDEKYCFGPAMNAAYYLESSVAVYPRIVLDENYKIYPIKSVNGIKIDENQYVTTDDDGNRFVDFMQAIAWDAEKCVEFTERSTKYLDNEYLNTQDGKVRMKNRWLRNYLRAWG